MRARQYLSLRALLGEARLGHDLGGIGLPSLDVGGLEAATERALAEVAADGKAPHNALQARPRVDLFVRDEVERRGARGWLRRSCGRALMSLLPLREADGLQRRVQQGGHFATDWITAALR